jgi:V8-like Glu-specific endopeptidase
MRRRLRYLRRSCVAGEVDRISTVVIRRAAFSGAAAVVAVAVGVVLLPTPRPGAAGIAASGGAAVAALAGAGRTGTAFDGTPAVGVIFIGTGRNMRHICTAAVVHSPQRDLVMTAAHCMEKLHVGLTGDVSFAPGYHDGKFPYGRWVVRSVFVDSNWQKDQDPNDDVAFLIVGKVGQEIEKKTGGETLKTNFKLPQNVEVIGHPDGKSEPIRCDGPVSALHKAGYRQLVFDCGGYTDGTSGGPFLTHISARTGLGELIGVIGGYQGGGDSPSVSYSARFLTNVANLYKQATSSSSAG